MLRRSIVCLCLFVFLPRLAASQIADLETSNKMAIQIVDLLNKGDAKSIAAMATEDFVKEATQMGIFGLVARVHSLGTLGAPELMLDLREQRHYKLVVKKEGKPDRSILLVIGAESPTRYFSIGFAPLKEPDRKPLLTDNRDKSTLDQSVQSAVERYAGQNNPVGISIAILNKGKESFYNYGEIESGKGTLSTNKTVYEIGSITKTMTGILLAQAAIDHKLSLEVDIRKYIPGSFPNLEFEKSPILIRHLASHTSGLPANPPGIPDDAGAEGYERYSHQQLLTDLATIKLKQAPGKVFSYSNMGGGLAGLVLEHAYGLTYEKLLDRFVFRPAGMKDSGITLTPSMEKMYATPHDSKGAKTDRWTVNGIEAAGAVRSNAADMLRYARFNLDERKPVVKLSHEVITGDDSVPMGLFWQRKDSRTGGRCLTHEGGTGGFTNNIILMPERKLAIVVLMNSGEQNAGQLGYEIALRIMNSEISKH